MQTQNLETLKINKLSKAQYERELAAGNIDENALYLTPEEEIDLSRYATKDVATTSAAGLMSSSDKSKLDSITNTPIVTSGDGSTYTATVNGITELTAGASFVMIPHVVSTTTTPKLNVNNLGVKYIRRKLSNGTATTVGGSSSNWLGVNKPIRVTYDGSYWVADIVRPSATDLYGVLPIASGGTGASTAETALTNLGLTTETWTFTLEDGSTVTKAVYVG